MEIFIFCNYNRGVAFIKKIMYFFIKLHIFYLNIEKILTITNYSWNCLI